MKTKLFANLALMIGVAVFGCLNGAKCQTNSRPQWMVFTDTNRHFHFECPASWKINEETIPVMHYRDVFVALNSMGTDHFTLRELETSPGTWQFGFPEILKQLPAGAVYMDIGWWEGPGPMARFGPDVHEMEASDLTPLLKAAKEDEVDGLITRQIEFHKWGRHWSIVIYMRPPIGGDQRRVTDRILASFRFDGVPAGDEIWAIGVTRKKLPPEADPDQFTREGGSAIYYTSTEKEGNDVVVTFTKSDGNKSKKTWRFRVTATGEVEPMDLKNP
jgi:hypothetical protein